MQEVKEKNTHNRKLEAFLFAADLLMIQVAFLIAIFVFHILGKDLDSFSKTIDYFLGAPNLVFTLYWVAILYISRFFRPLFPQTLYGEILRVFNVISLGIVVLLFATIDLADPGAFYSSSKLVMFFYWFSLIALINLNRLIFYKFWKSYSLAFTTTEAATAVVQKKLILIILDLIIVVLAFYLSFYVRFEGDIPINYLNSLKASLPVIIIIRFTTFFYFKLYSGYYRYSSVNDLVLIIKAVTVGTVLFVVPTFFIGYGFIPRSIFVIDWLAMVIFLGGSRVVLRILREIMPSIWLTGKRTFIIGAGSAGEMILRELKKTPMGIKPVGIIDDDPVRHGLQLHGVTVLGSIDALPALSERHKVTEAIIAIPSASGSQMRHIIEQCRKSNLNFKTTPPLREIIEGKVSLNEVRHIRVDDLLGRELVNLDTDRLGNFISGRRIMVTGGGGSIGSEICRQVLKFNPSSLIIVDRAENRLYDIMREIGDEWSDDNINPYVADIMDKTKMESIFIATKPDVIFHAAAYKQVPLMELFPEEAIRNNIFGTASLARMANDFSVESFVMISTDKAVRPTSVMGATKRVAEIFVQCFAAVAKTSFLTVRFGNVLDSDGSVVPLFRRQIEAGGPVTVTHPDVERYFMTISEASLLVIQAATIGNSGDILVLNMGEPVKIIDLAKAMITLSGAIPDQDIEIKITGLREGEKLFEELFIDEEGLELSSHNKIFRAHAFNHNLNQIESDLKRLGDTLGPDKKDDLIRILHEILPEFKYKAVDINN